MELHSVRPGEAVIVSGRRDLLGHKSLPTDAAGVRYGIAAEPGVPIIVTEEQAEGIAADHSHVRISNEERGTLPRFIHSADDAARATFRDGKPPEASRRERVVELQTRHNLASKSVAEATLRLIDAGWEEERAVQQLRASYAQALASSSAFREPWWEHVRALLGEEAEKLPANLSTGPVDGARPERTLLGGEE